MNNDVAAFHCPAYLFWTVDTTKAYLNRYAESPRRSAPGRTNIFYLVTESEEFPGKVNTQESICTCNKDLFHRNILDGLVLHFFSYFPGNDLQFQFQGKQGHQKMVELIHKAGYDGGVTCQGFA